MAHCGTTQAVRKWRRLRDFMDKIPGAPFRVPWYPGRVVRSRTIRANLFLWVSVLLVSLLLAFSWVVYDYGSTVARDRFSDALTSLSRSLVANLDAQVAEMNRLSLTLIYSQVFRDLYSRHLALPRSPSTVRQRITKLENTEALIEIADTILGPNQSAPQVNIFDLRGSMVGAGYYSRLIDRDVRTEPWFAPVMARQGDRLLLPPHVDPLQEQTSVVVKGKLYVSLVRSFRDPLQSIEGVVEVKQYCDSLFAELESLDAAVFVLDGTRVLYPYGPQELTADEQRALTFARAPGISTGNLPRTREPQIVATATSRDTGWTLVLGAPSAGLSTNTVQYSTRIALLTLGAILCSLVASYFLARRLTVPLQALHDEIEALELRNLDESLDHPPGSNLGEIDALRLAFRQMRLKLNESVDEAVALRAHERRAELVALQSQLNPHFLHNMLQTIAIMAEEGHRESLQSLITNLSKVLRYVASTEGTSTLGTEVEWAESYLSAMGTRFGDSLHFVIDVPRSLDEVAVPRLILQPLLENCFKYATQGRPPWRIGLRGEHSPQRWAIEITDNGRGFTDEARARVAQRMADARALGGLTPMSISGMGILHSAERLRLTFGDAAFVVLDNLPTGGARVVIGVHTHG